MPLSEILRSREAKGLTTSVTTPELPAEWQKSKKSLVDSLAQDGNDFADSNAEKTQVATIAMLQEKTKADSSVKNPFATHQPTALNKMPSANPSESKPRRTTTPTAAVLDPTLKREEPTKIAGSMADARPKTKSRNQVIVFFSCKGGSGSTSLSVNTAYNYAREQMKSCLIDMDLQLGDVLAALALKPRATIAQVIKGLQLGERVAKDRLAQHPSGLSVLSQVGSLDDLDKITSEDIVRLIDDMRGTFDTIVIDGVRDFSDNVLAVLDVADKICLVVLQEVLSIRRARWAFNILRNIGFDPKDITLVINQFNAHSDIQVENLRSMFAPASLITVCADRASVLASLNRGVSLQESNPNQRVTRNMMRLASNLAGATVGDEPDQTGIYEVSRFGRIMAQLKRFFARSS